MGEDTGGKWAVVCCERLVGKGWERVAESESGEGYVGHGGERIVDEELGNVRNVGGMDGGVSREEGFWKCILRNESGETRDGCWGEGGDFEERGGKGCETVDRGARHWRNICEKWDGLCVDGRVGRWKCCV